MTIPQENPPEAAVGRVAVLFTPVADTLHDAPADMKEEMDLAVSARAVADALRAAGQAAEAVVFGRDVQEIGTRLKALGPDVVFNLAECPHSSAQKEPHGAALLELLRLPYTGNGPLPLSVCNNKALTKHILIAHGIPTPRFRLYADMPKRRTRLSFPLIVKPAKEDGSAGITEESVVENEEQLRARVAHVVGKYGQEALVEEYVGGREFNVAVLGNGTAAAPYRALPPGELVYRNPKWRVCSFESKWDRAHPSYSEIAPQCPADVSAALRKRLVTLAVACARVFDLCGYARVDFRTDRGRRLHVLEVNPNPDISSDAGLARAAAAAGCNYEGLLSEIVRLGLERGIR
jgi:D-alanine-D-alanine ligase